MFTGIRLGAKLIITALEKNKLRALKILGRKNN